MVYPRRECAVRDYRRPVTVAVDAGESDDSVFLIARLEQGGTVWWARPRYKPTLPVLNFAEQNFATARRIANILQTRKPYATSAASYVIRKAGTPVIQIVSEVAPRLSPDRREALVLALFDPDAVAGAGPRVQQAFREQAWALLRGAELSEDVTERLEMILKEK